MTTLKLSSYMAGEIRWKLDVLYDNEEMLKEYGITQEQCDALRLSIPEKGGEWEMSVFAKYILVEEMRDYPTFIRQMCPAVGEHPLIPNNTKTFVYDDGGRQAAGYRGYTGDCVTRAIAIASGKPYSEVYKIMANGNATQRKTKNTRHPGEKTARKGIYTRRKWFKDYMKSIGFKWVATMTIGSGCRVHVKADELPKGRLVLLVSKHAVAMIDGVIHDIYDCSRDGTRCVYGYYIKV